MSHFDFGFRFLSILRPPSLNYPHYKSYKPYWPPCFQINVSEHQHAARNHEQWTKIQKQAVKNSNSKLPEGFVETEPLSPPPLVEDEGNDILAICLGEVSLDMQMLSGDSDNSEMKKEPVGEDSIFFIERMRG